MTNDAENVRRSFKRSKTLPNMHLEEFKVTYTDSISPSELILQYDQENYKMDHIFRGIALIINIMHFTNGHEIRHGSCEDVKKLTKVLSEELKFDVRVCKSFHINIDLIRKELQTGEVSIRFPVSLMPNWLTPLKVARLDHSNQDCLMIVIMTHGGKDGELYASDHHFDMEEVLSFFRGNSCPSLVGKPKLFFVQACRGTLLDRGAPYRGQISVDANNYNGNFFIPSTADQLIMYATCQGFSAFRTFIGSWFIQELCKHLKENKTEDFASLLTRVSRKVALMTIKDDKNSKYTGAKQIPVVVSSLTKKIYFHGTPVSNEIGVLPNMTTLNDIKITEVFKCVSETAQSLTEASRNMKSAAESFAENIKMLSACLEASSVHFQTKTPTLKTANEATSKIPLLKK